MNEENMYSATYLISIAKQSNVEIFYYRRGIIILDN